MTRIRFEDLPSTNTPRNAENLNKLNNVVISPTEPTTGEEVWIQKGKNLFDKNDITSGKYVSSSDGELGNLPSGFASGFIKINSNTSYYWNDSTDRGNQGAFYDENGLYLSGISSRLFTTPNNAKYVRLTGLLENLDTMQLEQGESATSYEPYTDKKIHTKNDNGVYEEFYSEEEVNKQVYSTEEQRVGTWIDGKPLYRKVFYSTTQIEAVAEYKSNTTIPNIDTITDIDIIIGTAGSVSAKSYWSSGNYFISTQYDKSNGLYIEATYGGFVGWTLIVEYTKTTD